MKVYAAQARPAGAMGSVFAAERLRAGVYAVLLAVGCALFIRWETAAKPDWSNDGYTYLIRAQTDAGIPYVQARTNARAWYADKPPMHDPRFVRSYNAGYPEYWSLFAPRMLYPWLASRLYPREGVRALLTVSNAAYVIAILAVYLLLLLYAGPEVSLLLAVCCALFPEVRLLARAPLTDMLAFALWCWTLLALCRYIRERTFSWFAFYAACALLMTLARPIPYVPLAAAGALFLWARRRGAEREASAAFAAGTAATALCILDILLANWAHAPSFGWILQHTRTGSRLAVHAPLAIWYAVRIAATSAVTVTALLQLLAPVAAGYWLWRNRSLPDAAIFAGVAASSILTVLLNPITGDVPRVVVLPLLPVIAAGLALAMPMKRSDA